MVKVGSHGGTTVLNCQLIRGFWLLEAKEIEEHRNEIDSNLVKMSFNMDPQRLNMFLQQGFIEAQCILTLLVTWGNEKQ